eukprot:m.186548 g.186548  ORF g.186548 m.186548 type:complete len:166 (+) comp16921_c0_seq1:2844-3341(+)
MKSAGLLLGGVGLALSVFALYVEQQASQVQDYQAPCDISTAVSCSRVFRSRWGKGFGVAASLFGYDSILNQPNSVYGILYYLVLLGYSTCTDGRHLGQALFVISIVASVTCAWLAYILIVHLETLCLVCTTTYLVNWAASLWLWRHVTLANLTLSEESFSHSKEN